MSALVSLGVTSFDPFIPRPYKVLRNAPATARMTGGFVFPDPEAHGDREERDPTLERWGAFMWSGWNWTPVWTARTFNRAKNKRTGWFFSVKGGGNRDSEDMERVEKHVESIGGVSLLTQAAVRWRQRAKHTEVSWRQKVFCFFFPWDGRQTRALLFSLTSKF